MSMKNKIIEISFLITHYNRPLDLKKCIDKIEKLNIPKSEIVVSDDGSNPENIHLLNSYSIDNLILSEKNQGLAANINKGIDACKGVYIIYCQEDFILDSGIKEILPECINLLARNRIDIVRFTSNIVFKKLIKLTDTILLIPKFSFKNFIYNAYQYSDHPFIVKKCFYNKYGYYLENTSGRYGETEFAIRLFKSNAKIAITKNKLARSIVGSKSVLINEENEINNKVKLNKSLIKILRAFRLNLECIFYKNEKRGLLTYKNLRNN